MTSEQASKTALILGITGQDGSYLSQFLLAKNYCLHGTARHVNGDKSGNLTSLGIADRVQLHRLDLSEADADIDRVLEAVRPDEIYHLAGVSSIGESLAHPIRTFQGIVVGTLKLLEAIERQCPKARLLFVSSGEVFGETDGAKESDPFRPANPYGIAKAAASWSVAQRRNLHGLHAAVAFPFNHESPLRPTHFVTQKIVRGARDIALGKSSELRLGRLDVMRDWGWAPDYVEAYWMMLQASEPEDFVIATGVPRRLEDFVSAAFAWHDLDWKNHVVSDPSFYRPTDARMSSGNPALIGGKLGWKPKALMPDVVRMMCEGLAQSQADQ